MKSKFILAVLALLSSMDETGRWVQVDVVHTVGLHHCQKTQTSDSRIFYKGDACKPDGLLPWREILSFCTGQQTNLLSILEEDSVSPRDVCYTNVLEKIETKTVSDPACKMCLCVRDP